MSEISKFVLRVPIALLRNWSGLSIDMGGSCVKLAYKQKDDLQENNQVSAVGMVRLAVYPNGDLMKALEFLREHCDITRKGDEIPLVFTTGIGGRKSRDVISQALSIRTANVGEFELSILSLKYFAAKMSQNDFLHLPSNDMLEEMRHRLEGTNKTMQTFKNSNKDMTDMIKEPSKPISPELPILDVVPDLFPCLMFGITSVTWGIVIQKEDIFKQTSIGSSSGGLNLLGLGSFICGEQKSYDELIDLAERGDNRKIDLSVLEAIPGEGEQDMYAGSRPQHGQYDDNVWMFSKTTSSPINSFKKEDIIRALLGSIVRQQCELMCSQMVNWNLKHVFIVGSFTNRLLVRKIMENEFQRQKIMLGNMLNGQGFDFQIHFSKYAGYMGALGAMIHSSEENLPRHIRTLANTEP